MVILCPFPFNIPFLKLDIWPYVAFSNINDFDERSTSAIKAYAFPSSIWVNWSAVLIKYGLFSVPRPPSYFSILAIVSASVITLLEFTVNLLSPPFSSIAFLTSSWTTILTVLAAVLSTETTFWPLLTSLAVATILTDAALEPDSITTRPLFNSILPWTSPNSWYELGATELILTFPTFS